ncbi:MAG TPA: GFA family protein [Gammaproteobacteria bacterium]|nr:GFA family protein [Gammaproteobacteria bacterium]
MTPYTGGCLCGGVRYKVSEPPTHTFYCHCTDCQKETGGPFASEIFVRAEAVSVTGAMDYYDVIGDSGKRVRRERCHRCGSPLVTEFDSDPTFICIKACSLDDASGLAPACHLYVKSKQPWDAISDGLPQYQGDMEW